MKYSLLTGGLLLAAAAIAAEPPATTADPSVATSPPTVRAPAAAPSAAADSAVGRGNPRRLQLQAEPAPATAPAAAAAAQSSTPAPSSGAAARRGTNDRIELEATQITGNAELPRVMYVVPWKRPELGDLNGRPARSLLDEVLAPVDRDVFRRQNRYYDALRPDAAQAQPAGEK